MLAYAERVKELQGEFTQLLTKEQGKPVCTSYSFSSLFFFRLYWGFGLELGFGGLAFGLWFFGMAEVWKCADDDS